MSGSLYDMPPRLEGQDGRPRCVGVEIEMSGVELPVIAGEVMAELGGDLEEVSEYEWKVTGSALGDFKIDLDFEYLQKLGRRGLEGAGGGRDVEQIAADALQAVMKNLIPCELISPPIPFEKLEQLDGVVERLRKRGANGTRQALFATFGLHLNPELPDLEVETILAYLRAFICLRSWLEEREQVVLSRKFSLFIRNYPSEYEDLVLAEDYAPGLAEFIDDYLAHNPTRNRMLDLLPLLAHLDEGRVVAVIRDQKLRKRPTFHYRLPNSDVDHPDWGVWRSWNDWVEVESLANDRDRLQEVCVAYRHSRQSGFFSMDYHSWTSTVTQWLSDPS